MTTSPSRVAPAVRALLPADRAAYEALLTSSWGSTRMASRGRIHELLELPGFVAQAGDDWLGYLGYEVLGDACEVAVLESLREGIGVGSALLARLLRLCLDRSLARLWLITTNDNTVALRWYQRQGFVLSALHRGSVSAARRTLKPEIPVLGLDGIEIRDELELELPPERWAALAGQSSVASR